MQTTKDRYELSVTVADTARELADTDDDVIVTTSDGRVCSAYYDDSHGILARMGELYRWRACMDADAGSVPSKGGAMITDRKALKAAKKLIRYCENTCCNRCIFGGNGIESFDCAVAGRPISWELTSEALPAAAKEHLMRRFTTVE